MGNSKHQKLKLRIFNGHEKLFSLINFFNYSLHLHWPVLYLRPCQFSRALDFALMGAHLHSFLVCQVPRFHQTKLSYPLDPLFILSFIYTLSPLFIQGSFQAHMNFSSVNFYLTLTTFLSKCPSLHKISFVSPVTALFSTKSSFNNHRSFHAMYMSFVCLYLHRPLLH